MGNMKWMDCIESLSGNERRLKLSQHTPFQQLINLHDRYWGYINITVQKDMDMWERDRQGTYTVKAYSNIIEFPGTSPFTSLPWRRLISCFSKTELV
jgi:hypothetical protein